MGAPLSPSTTGPAIYASTGIFASMPDGSIVNLNMAQAVSQDGNKVVLTFPNGTQQKIAYPSSTLAAAAIAGISNFLTANFGLLTLRSITPATAANGSTVNAVLVGTGFQFDILTGVFTGSVKVGGNSATVVYVNSATVLLQFTAPAPGTYDVVYTPTVGAPVTLTGAWVST